MERTLLNNTLFLSYIVDNKLVKCFLLIFLLISTSLCAQMGFGTNDPHPSSVADFEADDKGILIPRVVLTDLDNAKIKPSDSRSPAAAKSLLVYNKGNTDTSGGKETTTKGFYYWDGLKWVKIGSPSTSASSFLRKTANFTLDKSHHNATIKVDGKHRVTIPNDLPNGFKVTIIGDASERVSILSSVPTIGANPISQIIKNGVARMVFYKDKDDNPLVRLWGDLDSHEAFITKWEIPAKSTGKNTLKITKSSSLTYNYDVDWGDGKKDTGLTGDKEHTYDEGGTYFVTISGTFPHFIFGPTDDDKLQELINWGKGKWESMAESFKDAKNMSIIAQDVPDLSSVTSMDNMFKGCDAITTIPNVGSWDVSNVNNMHEMFKSCGSITTLPGLESWDVSGVTDMVRMFNLSSNFNQDISTWTPNINSYNDCFQYIKGTKMDSGNMVQSFNSLPGAPSTTCNTK